MIWEITGDDDRHSLLTALTEAIRELDAKMESIEKQMRSSRAG